MSVQETIRCIVNDSGDEAVFAGNADGSLTLTRWPRKKGAAVIPETVNDLPVRRIAPLAFAPFHMSENDFTAGFHSPYSFNMFLLMSGGRLHRENESGDEGGPSVIIIPGGVREIGPFAFWHCINLEKIRIPEGVTVLGAGVFGECVNLREIRLPHTLEAIGLYDPDKQCVFTSEMLRGMPDVGTFYACHALKELTMPSSVRILGPHVFNSCAITHLTLNGPEYDTAEEGIADNSFDHAASLQWMDRADADGRIRYRIGLPAARDKILRADSRFGLLFRIPIDFFLQGASYFDKMAQDVFRLDFSARMAIGRLRYDEDLSEKDRRFYLTLLMEHFVKAKQFMPSDDAAGDPYNRLFDALAETGLLSAEDVSTLIREAGMAHLPASLTDRMMRMRAENYPAATGFEDLEI